MIVRMEVKSRTSRRAEARTDLCAEVCAMTAQSEVDRGTYQLNFLDSLIDDIVSDSVCSTAE
jgi:hypothetical protein